MYINWILFLCKNIWNISQILKVDESSPQIQTHQESLEEIHTFIPISLGAKIQIYNSSLEILDEDEDLHLGLKIPNIELDFETKRDNTIPLSLKILELPKKFFFQLGEKEKEYKLFIKTKNSKIETNLVTFLQILKVKQELPIYDAELIFQTRNLKIHLPHEEISTHAEVQYNLKFEENSDSLAIENFQILLGKESAVQLKGNIKNISRSPEYSIQSKKFSFNFNEIGYLFKKTNLVNFEIGGSLDFSILEIFGTLENLKLNLSAYGNNLLHKSSNSLHAIKYLKLNSKANLNLVGQTPIIPYIKTLKIEPLELNYNSSNIKLVGNIEDLLEARLNLENLPIENYASSLSGRINGNLKLNGKSIEDLKTELSFFWKGFQILQSDFKTNYANLSGRINGNLSFNKGFSLRKISLNSLELNLLNNFNNNALNVKGSQISILLTPLIINTKSFLVSTNLRAVLLILPLSLADTISDLR
ncbi:MAG: hypothetical protein N3A69_14485, partial [Leptospiraceae bacterium]|nr:hypothetical protein [Leptospiraceae bacterium]